MSNELTILGWHNVEGTWCFPSDPGAGEKGLYRQLRAIKRSTNVVDLETALDDLENDRPLPLRAFALTFDDGYRDNLTTAAPMLASLELPATFFLAPGLLSREPLGWWEGLASAFDASTCTTLSWREQTFSLTDGRARAAYDAISAALKKMNQERRLAEVAELIKALAPARQTDAGELFLDWDEAVQLTNWGMKVGSHSLDHAILANETPDVQESNLKQAKQLLEARLNVPVKLLAYPNGLQDDFDQVTERAAEEAGHTASVTTIAGSNSGSTPRYRLRRFVLYPERGLRTLVRLSARMVRNRVAVRPNADDT